jgi:hypothetical protein
LHKGPYNSNTLERQLYKTIQEKSKKSDWHTYLTPTNPKRIIAVEARNSLKLGAYVREKQETP